MNNTPSSISPMQNQLLNQAIKLHQAGNLNDAEILYNELLLSLPNHTLLLTNMGTIAVQKGEFDKGILLIDKSLSIDPNQPSALNTKGIAFKVQNLLQEALLNFDKAITINPNYAEAYSNKGITLQELKRLNEALASYENAIAINPNHFQTYCNRGNTLKEMRRLDEALINYDKAIEINPDYFEAYFNRGVAFQELKRLDEAEASYSKAIEINPNYAQAYSNLGLVLQKLKRLEEALTIYEKVIAINPNYADAYFNRGVALQELKRLEAAVESYSKTIEINPNYAQAYSNRGVALDELKRPNEALANYDNAIEINPNYAQAYCNRGATLQNLNKPSEALINYDKAILINPNFPEAYFNRGNILKELKRFNEAFDSYDTTIAINPNYAMAYWNKSLLKILNGDYLEGWQLYEWGWKAGQRTPLRKLNSKLWLGHQSIAGKTVLIYPEQGLGDCIQCLRYAKLVEEQGAHVILELPFALMSIASTLEGSFTLIETGKTLPDFDYHCPIMSLPLAFRTTLETIPKQLPYLYPNVHKKTEWQQRLGHKTKMRVGLVWSGATVHKNDHNRSIPFETLKSLFNLPIEYHCLQKQMRPDDESAAGSMDMLTIHKDFLLDFSDTAALISEMDVVISVDTSVAHLAGALGQEVWILLPYAPDYRWMLDRDDSPWYPTAKLFRQTELGDWEGVIKRISDELKE